MDNPDIKISIKKLEEIFIFMDFTNKALEDLKQKVIVSCTASAYSKLIAIDKTFADKLKTVDEENEESIKQLTDKNFMSPAQQEIFAREFEISLNEYLENLSNSVAPSQKAKIQEIWSAN